MSDNQPTHASVVLTTSSALTANAALLPNAVLNNVDALLVGTRHSGAAFSGAVVSGAVVSGAVSGLGRPVGFASANRGHRGLDAATKLAATKLAATKLAATKLAANKDTASKVMALVSTDAKAGAAVTDIAVTWVSRPRRILLER
jgi:hypothetical protein